MSSSHNKYFIGLGSKNEYTLSSFQLLPFLLPLRSPPCFFSKFSNSRSSLSLFSCFVLSIYKILSSILLDPRPPPLPTAGNIDIPVPLLKVLLFWDMLSSVRAAKLLVSSFLFLTNLAVLPVELIFGSSSDWSDLIVSCWSMVRCGGLTLSWLSDNISFDW